MADKRHQFALPNGTLIQEYEIQGVLGYGNFGIVYQAKHIYFDDIVALKEFLPCEVACRSEQDLVVPISPECEEIYSWALDRFVDEAKLIWDLGLPEPHPNIVQVKGFHKSNGTAYMVMKLENGEPLSNVLEQHAPLPQDQIESIVYPLMDGLERTHAASVWHRDIKPSNILIRPDGSPVLIDFGAAKQEIGDRAKTIIVIYTENFAPPEQKIPGSNQGPWTDIYSLGATMYQAVFRKAPGIRTECNSDVSHTPAIQAVDQGYDLQFLKAIDTAIELKPSSRPQTMKEFRELLGASETRVYATSLGTKIYKPPPQPPHSSPSTLSQQKSPPPRVSIFRRIIENTIALKLATIIGVVLLILLMVTLLVPRSSDNLIVKSRKPEKLLSVIKSMTDSVECSYLDSQLSDDFELNISGHVSGRDDLQKLRNRLNSLHELKQIYFDLEIYQPPFCAVLSVLERHKRQNSIDTQDISIHFNQSTLSYVVGECLVIQAINTGGYDGFLYIDFYDGLDDSVVHLRPTPENSTNALRAAEKQVFGRAETLCRSGAPGSYRLTSPSKYLISTIYSERPLFDRGLSDEDQEEPINRYLNRLKTAVESIPSAEKPIIRFDFITVTD